MKDDYLLVECNTRAINEYNHELGNTINTANNALQNFANQVGFNLNPNNNFNLPTISEDSVGCSKVVLKRMYNIIIIYFVLIKLFIIFIIIIVCFHRLTIV